MRFAECCRQLPELIGCVLGSKAQRGHIAHGCRRSTVPLVQRGCLHPRRGGHPEPPLLGAGELERPSLTVADLLACARRGPRPPARPAAAGGRPPTAPRVPARTTVRPRVASATSPTTEVALTRRHAASPSSTVQAHRNTFRTLGHSAREPLVPVQLVGALDAGVGGLCPRDVVVELATHARRHPSSSLEAGLAVLAHGLELSEARAERSSIGGEQRLVDQRHQEILHRHGGVPADCSCRVRTEVGTEDGELIEERLLDVGQQVVRPRNGGAQALVAGVDAATTSEHLEAVVEVCSELSHRHRRQPGRRQLDRQRETVEPPADLVDDGDVRVGRLEAAEHGRGTLTEQPHGVGCATVTVHVEGRQVETDLVAEPECLAARRQHGDPIAV